MDAEGLSPKESDKDKQKSKDGFAAQNYGYEKHNGTPEIGTPRCAARP